MKAMPSSGWLICMQQRVRLKCIPKTLSSVCYPGLASQISQTEQLRLPRRHPPFERIPRRQMRHREEIQPHGGGEESIPIMTCMSGDRRHTHLSAIILTDPAYSSENSSGEIDLFSFFILMMSLGRSNTFHAIGISSRVASAVCIAIVERRTISRVRKSIQSSICPSIRVTRSGGKSGSRASSWLSYRRELRISL